jgi:predicted permease
VVWLAHCLFTFPDANVIRRFGYWARALLRRSALEREMHDEMQVHLDHRTQQLIAGGLTPGDAASAARYEFGNVGLIEDQARDARGTQTVDSFVADVRFALRHFTRKPLFAAAIVLTLAIGIGGHAFELSLLRGFLSRPGPGLSRDLELVRLRGMWRPADSPEWRPRGFSYPELRRMTELRSVFSAVAGWTTSEVVLDVPGAIDGATARAFFVTDDYFGLLGLRQTHGPGLPRGEIDEPLVAVISHAMWRGTFAEDSVVGRVVTVNGTAVRIVGVTSPRFTGVTDGTERPVFWMPLAARGLVLRPSGASSHALASLDSTLFDAVARLQPGASPQSASAAVRVVSSQAVAGMSPDSGRARTVYDADVVWLRGTTDVDEDDIAFIGTAGGVITTLLLLLVCANVGALVVSAGVARRQEIAIRLSLGASRTRVIRQLLTESALLALAGGVLGFGLFWTAVDLVARRFPNADWLRPDLPTAILTMCAALGTGLLFGLTPALHATRLSVSGVLRGSGGGTTRRSRLQQTFVVSQIALTQPLLVAIASLLAQVFVKDRPQPKEPDRALRLVIQAQSIPGSDSASDAALERLAKRIAEIPGVTGVLPDAVLALRATFAVRSEDRGSLARANDPIVAYVNAARPGYFALLGVPLLRGDEQPPADTTRAVIVSDALARELWGNADPLGKRLSQIAPGAQPARDVVVTGVYDSRYLTRGEKREQIYRLVPKLLHGGFLIRTAGPAAGVTLAIRRVVHQELPSTPTQSLLTLAQVEAISMETDSNVRLIATTIGALVLGLASIGLYGVVALSVGQRRREIGVRMALGARAVQVVSLFYRKGVALTTLGVAIGLPLSLIGAHVFNGASGGNLLGGADLLGVGIGVIVGVFVVASIATLVPSRRATRVDPVTVLRSE